MAGGSRRIRVRVPPRKLTNQLGEVQSEHITAEPCIRAGNILHKRIELVRGSLDTQIAFCRDLIIDFVINIFGHFRCVEYTCR